MSGRVIAYGRLVVFEFGLCFASALADPAVRQRYKGDTDLVFASSNTDLWWCRMTRKEPPNRTMFANELRSGKARKKAAERRGVASLPADL